MKEQQKDSLQVSNIFLANNSNQIISNQNRLLLSPSNQIPTIWSQIGQNLTLLKDQSNKLIEVICQQTNHVCNSNSQNWISDRFSGESEDQQISEIKIKKKSKNETKNIPKNFAKAIIKQKLHANDQMFKQFIQLISKQKDEITTISKLRQLWSDFKYAKWMRIISDFYLRKYGLGYTFNSRVSSYNIHIKYRSRLRQVLMKPQAFKHIKEY